MRSTLAAITLLVCFGAALASAAAGAEGGGYSTAAGQWPQYGGDLANSKYSPLAQIHRDNVADLRIAWIWDSIDGELAKSREGLQPDGFKGTPLMIDEVLYLRTSLNAVAAIDAATGRTLWVYDPKSYLDEQWPAKGWTTRGLAYWRGGKNGAQRRLFVATRDLKLIALDPGTGRPVPGFGHDGAIDLREGLRGPLRFPDTMWYTSPPAVCRDSLVIGSVVIDAHYPWVGEEPPLDVPTGDVRAFDVLTGKPLWTFHTVPKADEFGIETWENDAWKWVGNTNVWSIIGADEKLGIVYLPVTAPTNDWWGGFRPGDNLFGQSLVAVDAATGKRVWHQQLIHHPIWDYDLAAPPILVDVEIEGHPVRAVVQLTKTGFAFVFDRATGKPVWPIEERPAPPSTVPGEITSPTQPFPTRPPAIETQGVRKQDLIDFTPELAAEAERFVSQYDHGSLFTPVSRRGTILAPGIFGGVNWTGGGVDPETGMLYVPSMTKPTVISLEPGYREWPYYYIDMALGRKLWPFRWKRRMHETTLDRGIPFLKPPWSRITAIDLRKGTIAWQVVNGDGPRYHPRLRELDLPPLGSIGMSSPLVTRTLLFAAATGEGTFTREGEPGKAIFRAFDKATGSELWRRDLGLDYSGAAPMTYSVAGVQYVVIGMGGGTLQPSRLVAFALKQFVPEERKESVAERPTAFVGPRRFAGPGAKVFQRNCAACHSIGYGQIQGPDLHGIWNLDEAGIRSAIAGMQKRFDVRLDAAETQALVEFLRRPDARQILDGLPREPHQ